MSGPDPSSPHHHHRKAALVSVPTAVIAVSDTRDLASDAGAQGAPSLLPLPVEEIAGEAINRRDENGAPEPGARDPTPYRDAYGG